MEQILRRKDIILVPFPFSDQINSKKRPALIISSDNFNEGSEDVIACAITSNTDHEHSVYIKPEDWKDGLYSESCVKVSSIFTIEKKIILKRIGRLNAERFGDVSKVLNELIK